jgi:hypothetical protein
MDAFAIFLTFVSKIGWAPSPLSALSLIARIRAEREITIRECAEVCKRHSNMSWNDDRRTQSKVLASEILALSKGDRS